MGDGLPRLSANRSPEMEVIRTKTYDSSEIRPVGFLASKVFLKLLETGLMPDTLVYKWVRHQP